MDRLRSIEEFVSLVDEVAPKPGRPNTYKKRVVAGQRPAGDADRAL